MITKRIFIFRIDGTDFCIVDNAKDAAIIYDQLEKDHGIGYKWERTDLNFLTTTYYFTTKTK